MTFASLLMISCRLVAVEIGQCYQMNSTVDVSTYIWSDCNDERKLEKARRILFLIC